MTSRLSKQGEGMDVTPDGPALPGIMHHYAEVNGTRLHYVAAGTSGSPVLLVPGVPETWWAFRKLLPPLPARPPAFPPHPRRFRRPRNQPGGDRSPPPAHDPHPLLRPPHAPP